MTLETYSLIFKLEHNGKRLNGHQGVSQLESLIIPVSQPALALNTKPSKIRFKSANIFFLSTAKKCVSDPQICGEASSRCRPL